MNKPLASVLAACVLLAGGAALLGAPAQDRTQQPGQPTQGKVWIQNRDASEAVPVTIQHVASEPPLPVQVTGVPAVTIASGNVVLARVVRQPWEYREVTIPPGQDPAPVLNAAGVDGWEAIAVALVDQGRTAVVMKRPR